MDQIKELDERRKHIEQTSRGKVIQKEREIERVTETFRQVGASVEILRNEELALQAALSAKRVVFENLSDEVSFLKRRLEEKTQANKNALMAAAAELDQEESILAGMVKEYEECQTLLNAPDDVIREELIQQESLQMQIAEAKREQVAYDQQKRIAEQEVRGLDRIYDKRFLVLQKIGFVLRNETYLRRLLEKKFYRSSNFMSLKELGKMDESPRKRSMAKDPELKAFGDQEPTTAGGDRLSISSSMNLLQSMLTSTEPDNCTINAIIIARKVEEPDGWW
ncbi:hypothetical protein RvY_09729 [Ramazzottius varieornatus]|uniref:Uncharacterized protein n=1 Tax=Ramazzottius varieornatus TaxID=947166 RepID=A0A1D1VAE3_RAMVA|nr:hypothetical protein RvY_09729 [Ramazzottius varieornatus]